jgi:glutathione S-transferase
LVRITAKLLDIEYNEIDINAKVEGPNEGAAAKKKEKTDKKDAEAAPVNPLLAKSLVGKFPVLETPEGFTIFEATSIAKYFARQRKGFYGHNDFESKITF